MARTRMEKRASGMRAAIYARVSDKSQDTEDKTSISEQIGEMEAYCESRGLNITARYQEVGRGWSKKRPEFQRMLADAKRGRFDTIVCWKSDRLSRGMYPAAALMEVVEAHQTRLEAVMDAIDMKTFGLMAAIGKIELDNFRERSTLGKRGTAKQGRVPMGGLPYGYRIGDDGRPEVVEEQAEIVRRIFHMYVHEGMGSPSIAVQLTDEGIPTQTGRLLWRQSYIHYVLANATYTGTWVYGKTRVISTDYGTKEYDQPRDTWIEVPVPPLVDEKTWERAQKLKKQRSKRAKRNTKVLYLLQHLLRCGECGHNFHAKSTWRTSSVRNGKRYRYDLPTPRRYYMCNGTLSLRLRCRERSNIRAERLEEPIWSEVKRVIQNPDLIVAGIDTLDSQEGGGLVEETAQAERDLRSIQMEEDRAIRLFVSGKITETQLDHQRRFITERLESARAKLDDYRAQEASGAEKRRLMEAVLAWAREVGQGLDELAPEQRRIQRYGFEEHTVGKPDDEAVEDGRNSRRRKYRKVVRERPGLVPSALFHIIGNTVFLRLADVASGLPPYEEQVMLSSMDSEEDATGYCQRSAYNTVYEELRLKLAEALKAGSKRLLATYLQTLLAYPDGCTRGETVFDPRSGDVVVQVPLLGEGRLYPKEKALIDMVAAERMEGRRVLVYATHTGTRDITGRMDDMLTRHGFRVAVMKADAVAPERREAWVADRVKEGIDVMICHPRLVQTGLDLIDFPTLIWYETEFFVFQSTQQSTVLLGG